MKDRLIIIILCGLITILSSCGEIKLKAAIEAKKNDFPISLGHNGELTSISYDDDIVSFVITVNESNTNIDKLAAHPEAMKSFMMIMLANPNEKAKVLSNLIADAEADLCIKFVGNKTGKEAFVIILADEYKRIIKDTSVGADNRLAAAIVAKKIQTPFTVAPGMTITDIVDEGDKVMYKVRLDNIKQLKLIEQNRDIIIKNYLTTSRMEGEGDKAFFRFILDSGKTLGFRYYANNSNKTVEIVLQPSELAAMIGK